MLYLYIHMNEQIYVCAHETGEDVILSDASKSAGMKYSKAQIADEQKRVNTYLESIGQSTYRIAVNDSSLLRG